MHQFKTSLKIWTALTLLLPMGAIAGVEVGFVLPGITGTESLGGINGLIPIVNYSFSLSDNVFAEDRYVDPLSPLLHDAVLSNQHFGSATVYVFDSSGAAPVQLAEVVTMSNVVADSYSLFHFGGRQGESSTFSYSRLVTTFPGQGGGGTVSAPELDATSTASAISLLVGGLLVVSARRRPRSIRPPATMIA